MLGREERVLAWGKFFIDEALDVITVRIGVVLPLLLVVVVHSQLVISLAEPTFHAALVRVLSISLLAPQSIAMPSESEIAEC